MNPFSALIDLSYDAKNLKAFHSDNTLYVTQWNWDFQKALDFQKKAQELVQSNRKLKVYIFCNHPHCFTMGRGNERGVEGLADFDVEVEKTLNFPLYHIHRGGGITFHHPGQWIFYPIVALGPNNTLDNLMNWMLQSVRDVIREQFGVKDVITANKLMGVWHQRSKLASIGIGINRFVTEHGLALNILRDEKMFEEIQKVSPCGISSNTYIALEELISPTSNLIEEFHNHFVEKIKSAECPF